MSGIMRWKYSVARRKEKGGVSPWWREEAKKKKG
jgi:hypothetical protein